MWRVKQSCLMGNSCSPLCWGCGACLGLSVVRPQGLLLPTSLWIGVAWLRGKDPGKSAPVEENCWALFMLPPALGRSQCWPHPSPKQQNPRASSHLNPGELPAGCILRVPAWRRLWPRGDKDSNASGAVLLHIIPSHGHPIPCTVSHLLIKSKPRWKAEGVGSGSIPAAGAGLSTLSCIALLCLLWKNKAAIIKSSGESRSQGSRDPEELQGGRQ